MTREEKTQQLQHLKEQLEEQRVKMVASDGKAAKCSKMGLSFEDKYPDDYAEYVAANESYNAIEAEIAELETTEAEEPEPAPADAE